MELICHFSDIMLASSGYVNIEFVFDVFGSDFAVVPKGGISSAVVFSVMTVGN
jgi:hypothetical protein